MRDLSAPARVIADDFSAPWRYGQAWRGGGAEQARERKSKELCVGSDAPARAVAGQRCRWLAARQGRANKGSAEQA